MKRRYQELSRTGSAGTDNDVDQKIMRVMVNDVHIMGDEIGTSNGEGLKILGTYNFTI